MLALVKGVYVGDFELEESVVRSSNDVSQGY